LTPTLLVTIIIEGIVVSAYAIWRGKPLGPILLTSILVNILTQSLLWTVLNLFFRHYGATLWIAEFLIWAIEGLCLYGFRFNRLTVREAIWLSLSMNLASFGLGWLLPV
jgi:hypothetical protein